MEELLLLEGGHDDYVLALELLRNLADPVGSAPPSGDTASDWLDLTSTDLDIFVLRLRDAMLGNRIVTDVYCPEKRCRTRIDISFEIDAYIAHQFPSRGRNRADKISGEPGWFRLAATRRNGAEPSNPTEITVTFRLPTVGDLLSVAAQADAERQLEERCIRPSGIPAGRRLAVEAAMERLAPCMSQVLRGQCPECGVEVTAAFNPRQYCLRELRNLAAFLYEEVDVLARRYHWPESLILALPWARRKSYAEVARRRTDAAS
jgi:hypothetical protein